MDSSQQQRVPLSQPFTADDAVKFTATALSYLFTQTAAKPAILAACHAMHLDISDGTVDEYLKAAVTAHKSTPMNGTPNKKGKKPEKPRKLSPYSLFAVKMAQQLREQDLKMGNPAASNYMLQATSTYKTFSAEWKKRFAEVYGPLVQKLNGDAIRNFGNGIAEHPKLLDEVLKFEAEHSYPGVIDPGNAEALVTTSAKKKKPKLSTAADVDGEAVNGQSEEHKSKKKKKKRQGEFEEGAAVASPAAVSQAPGNVEDGRTEEKKKKKKKKKIETEKVETDSD